MQPIVDCERYGGGTYLNLNPNSDYSCCDFEPFERRIIATSYTIVIIGKEILENLNSSHVLHEQYFGRPG